MDFRRKFVDFMGKLVHLLNQTRDFMGKIVDLPDQTRTMVPSKMDMFRAPPGQAALAERDQTQHELQQWGSPKLGYLDSPNGHLVGGLVAIFTFSIYWE